MLPAGEAVQYRSCTVQKLPASCTEASGGPSPPPAPHHPTTSAFENQVGGPACIITNRAGWFGACVEDGTDRCAYEHAGGRADVRAQLVCIVMYYAVCCT